MLSTEPLKSADPEISKLVDLEIRRKEYSLEFNCL